MRQLSVLGYPSAIAVPKDPSIRQRCLAEVFRWADEGLIDPQVSHACPLDACREAMLARWRGDVMGDCVRNP